MNYLITGATSGIGKQIFKDLVGDGDFFAVAGKTAEKIKALQEETSFTNVKYFCGDLNDNSHIEELINSADKFDGVVLCAGIPGYKPVGFVSQHLKQIMDINFFSQAYLAEQLVKKNKLNKNASVVFISSVAALNASSGLSAYAASKGALNSFARVMALEVAKKGIRVNCLCPGMVETPLALQVRKELSEEAVQQDMKRYPLGYAETTDVSGVVKFFLSDAARKITGQTLVIDGGFSIQ